MLCHVLKTTSLLIYYYGGELNARVPWTQSEDPWAQVRARHKFPCVPPLGSQRHGQWFTRGNHGHKQSKTLPPCPPPAQDLYLSNKFMVLDKLKCPPPVGLMRRVPNIGSSLPPPPASKQQARMGASRLLSLHTWLSVTRLFY